MLLFVGLVLGGWHPGAARASESELVRGLKAVEAVLPWHDRETDSVTNGSPRPLEEDVTLLLSKYHYPADDGYVDAVVWLDAPLSEAVDGRLEVALHDEHGRLVARDQIASLPGPQLYFSVRLPGQVVGRQGELYVRWRQADGRVRGEAHRRFAVGEPKPVATSGRVRVDVPNTTEAVAQNVPLTVGVPFPRGALASSNDVRLVDEQDNVVPVQVKETARWSRYGSVKWLLCDFTADVDGEGRTFYLEYGPDIVRTPGKQPHLIAEQRDDGFPHLETGRLAVRDTGIYFDVTGNGTHERVLPPQALHGGYVEHENGRVYRMAPDASPVVEMDGDEKVVLLASGYYVDATDERFCRYHTRYVLHRDSPVVRIIHTWIFTGDSNRDRIVDMGWRFDLAEDQTPAGFLRSFDEARWEKAFYLLQHDFDRYDRVTEPAREGDNEGRLPGVMSATSDRVRLTIGIRDFWQNFPSELSATPDALTFHNWPRHGRAARHAPATPDDAHRLWFAHEGEVMDLRLPDEFAQDPIWSLTHQNKPETHRDWNKGRPENVNAQGIARTEEMWLYFDDAARSAEQTARVMEGLNDETLRAIASPQWVAASGAFYEIHHKDIAKYPEHERIYHEVALVPQRWAERLGLYGMWIYGDTMWAPYLWQENVRLYRAFRKSHHGWPYSWIPYARSGDPQLLRLAQAGTRQMYDANFCHYYTSEVDKVTGESYPRRRGLWYRSALPWAGRERGPVTRSYQSEIDYLLHAYYLTGDRRAMDIVNVLWGEEIKVEEDLPYRGRIHGRPTWIRQRQVLMKAGLEMYEATHDPWALVYAHALADLDRTQVVEHDYLGNTYEPGKREFMRFTGDPAYRDEVYLPYARKLGSEHDERWAFSQPQIEPNAYGWWLTGDRYFLRRLAHEVDWARQSIYEGEPDYYRGYYVREAGWEGASLFTGYYLQQFPLALAAFEAAGEEPMPLPNRFYQGPQQIEARDEGDVLRMPTIAFRKAESEALPLDLRFRSRSDGTARYHVRNAEGTTVLKGTWDIAQPGAAVLDPEMAAGTYWLEMEVVVDRAARDSYYAFQGLYVPLTPRGTPEVLVPEQPSLGRSLWEGQYWFRVPDQMERLELALHVKPDHRQLRRMSIWNNDLERVWDQNLPIYGWQSTDTESVVASIDIPATQRGRLWRVTLPGRNGGFDALSAVPAAFAVSPDRWFDPQEESEATGAER